MSKNKVSLQDEASQGVMPEGDDSKVTGYSVVLDSIKGEFETQESFALKFSVLMRLPVTKVKHMISRLPNTIWTGKKLSKANALLELIDEAGGVGHIVENIERPGEKAEEPEKEESGSEGTCQKCGFPLKEKESYCSFCMTPVKGQQSKKSPHKPVIEKSPMIPSTRLLFYIIILLAGVVLAIVLR
jgi:hypothetical protein